MRNPVTWVEIIGTDASVLHDFYREVFGWELTPPVADMGDYSMLAEHGPAEKGAGGGIGAGPAARVSVYIEVDEPQGYVDRAMARGGQVLMPVTEIVPGTTIAMLTDPAGNTFGLMKANPPQKSTARKKTAARKTSTPKKAVARKKTSARKTTGQKKTTARKKTTRRR